MAWFEVSVLASTTSVALPKLMMAPPPAPRPTTVAPLPLLKLPASALFWSKEVFVIVAVPSF
jgi:hypothetical protein